MPILLMLGWWYTSGWLWVFNQTQKRLRTISQTFAVAVLIRTWFSPWKRIYRESTFATFFRDAVDNMVSRVIGSFVRGSVLLFALVLSIFVLIAGIISLIVWPFIPLLTIILPVIGVTQ